MKRPCIFYPHDYTRLDKKKYLEVLPQKVGQAGNN